jgi:hypothetical protein
MSNFADCSARYFGKAYVNYDVGLARGAYFCTFKKIPDSCLKGSKVFEFLPHWIESFYLVSLCSCSFLAWSLQAATREQDLTAESLPLCLRQTGAPVDWIVLFFLVNFSDKPWELGRAQFGKRVLLTSSYSLFIFVVLEVGSQDRAHFHFAPACLVWIFVELIWKFLRVNRLQLRLSQWLDGRFSIELISAIPFNLWKFVSWLLIRHPGVSYLYWDPIFCFWAALEFVCRRFRWGIRQWATVVLTL